MAGLKYYFAKIIRKINFPAVKNSAIDRTAKICSGAHVVNTTVGRYSYVGNFCTVIHTQIGNFCSVADNCIIGGASHPIQWVSTSPVFIKGKNVLKKNLANNDYDCWSETKIGNDVWIGNNVLIKSGISVGNGSVIGMGSVVTHDIGDYEIWAGNPARKIRDRFDKTTVIQLHDSKWWNIPDRELEKFGSEISDIEKFILTRKRENK